MQVIVNTCDKYQALAITILKRDLKAQHLLLDLVQVREDTQSKLKIRRLDQAHTEFHAEFKTFSHTLFHRVIPNTSLSDSLIIIKLTSLQS